MGTKQNIWQPIENDSSNMFHARIVQVDGHAVDHDNLTILRDKVLECVPKGSTFYPFQPDTSMLAQPGTHRYYANWQVGVCHPSFDNCYENGSNGLMPFHDKQILSDGSIAEYIDR